MPIAAKVNLKFFDRAKDIDLSEFEEFIEEASGAFDVPREIIESIILTESSGKVEAKSSKGAVGLMGLAKGTADDMGVVDRESPRQNILGGTKYFRQQLDEFGNVEDALAAYNTGPRAFKEIKSGKRSKGKLSTETINYIDRVQLIRQHKEGETGKLIDASLIPPPSPEPETAIATEEAPVEPSASLPGATSILVAQAGGVTAQDAPFQPGLGGDVGSSRFNEEEQNRIDHMFEAERRGILDKILGGRDAALFREGVKRGMFTDSFAQDVGKADAPAPLPETGELIPPSLEIETPLPTAEFAPQPSAIEDEAAVGLPEEVASAVPPSPLGIEPSETLGAVGEQITAAGEAQTIEIPPPERSQADIDVGFAPEETEAQTQERSGFGLESQISFELQAQTGIGPFQTIKLGFTGLSIAGASIPHALGQKELVPITDADIYPQVIFKGQESPIALAAAQQRIFLPSGELLEAAEEAIPGPDQINEEAFKFHGLSILYAPKQAGTSSPELFIGEDDPRVAAAPFGIRQASFELWSGIMTGTAIQKLLFTGGQRVDKSIAQILKIGEEVTTSRAPLGRFKIMKHLDDGQSVEALVKSVQSGTKNITGKTIKPGMRITLGPEILESGGVRMHRYIPGFGADAEIVAKVGDILHTADGKTLRIVDETVTHWTVESSVKAGKGVEGITRKTISKDPLARAGTKNEIASITLGQSTKDLAFDGRQMNEMLDIFSGKIKSEARITAHMEREIVNDIPQPDLGDIVDVTKLKRIPKGVSTPLDPSFMYATEYGEVVDRVAKEIGMSPEQLAAISKELPDNIKTWEEVALEIAETRWGSSPQWNKISTKGKPLYRAFRDKKTKEVTKFMKEEAASIAGVPTAELSMLSKFVPAHVAFKNIETKTGVPLYTKLYATQRQALGHMRLDGERMGFELQEIFGKELYNKNTNKAFNRKVRITEHLEAPTTRELRLMSDEDKLLFRRQRGLADDAKIRTKEDIAGGMVAGDVQKSKLLREWYDKYWKLAIEGDIPSLDPEKYLKNYSPRVRTGEALAADDPILAGMPKDMVAFFTKERAKQGGLAVTDMDADLLARFWKQAYLKQKHLSAPLEEARKMTKLLPGTEAEGMQGFVTNYINATLGRPMESELVIQKAWQRTVKSMKPFMSESAFARLDRHAERALPTRRIANMMYKVYLGHVPASAVKNHTQKLLAFSALGSRWMTPATLKYSVISGGKISGARQALLEFVENSGVLSRAAEFMLDNRGLGWFSAAHLDNQLKTIGGALDKFEHFGRKLGAGEITKAQFLKKIDFSFLHPVVQKQVAADLNAGRIFARLKNGGADYGSAAWKYADYFHILTQFPYEAGAAPAVFQGALRPVFGVFQSWWVNYSHFLSQVIKRPGRFKKATELIAWSAATQQAAEHALGVDISNWFGLGPFPADLPLAPAASMSTEILFAMRANIKNAYEFDPSQGDVLQLEDANRALARNIPIAAYAAGGLIVKPLGSARTVNNIMRAMAKFREGNLTDALRVGAGFQTKE